MFVRWQLYRSRAVSKKLRKRNNARARLKAMLIESVRIDGKPRQKHIAFLGSTSIDGGDRLRFWCNVTERLDQLDNRLTAQNRRQIISAIAKRLGERPPTQEQLKRFRRRRDELTLDLYKRADSLDHLSVSQLRRTAAPRVERRPRSII